MTKSKWLKKIKMKNFKMPKMKINSNLIVKTQRKLKMIKRSPTRKDLNKKRMNQKMKMNMRRMKANSIGKEQSKPNLKARKVKNKKTKGLIN